MKKKLLLLLLPFLSLAAFAQPCNIDTTITTPGIYPVNGTSTGFAVVMPDAVVGAAYSEVVQIKAPSDTLIDTVFGGIPIVTTVPVDSLMIVRFDNLPASLSVQCDNQNCFWLGGANGCTLFTGTPVASEVGTYNGKIVATGWVQVPVLGTLTDTFAFDVKITVLPMQSIDEYVNSQSVKVSPNPITTVGALDFQAVKSEEFTFKMIDITGRVVNIQTGTSRMGMNRIEINREGLPNGIYFYSLEVKGEAISGRLVLAD